MTQAVFDRLRDDFGFFLGSLWNEIGLPKPSRIQLDIADWIAHGPKRRGVKAFRSVSKTWIMAAYVCWRLFRNQNERIMLCSQSLAHSRKTLFMIRGWLDRVSFLKPLAPNPNSRQRDQTDLFDVSGADNDRTPSIAAYGITGQIVGQRATLIVPDDIETLENSITSEQRDRTRQRAAEFKSIISPDGDILYLGTPHHEESIYDYLAQQGYLFRSWPVQYPTPEQLPRIPDLAPMLLDDLQSHRVQPADPVWPQRFGPDYIQDKQSAGRWAFDMQFMLLNVDAHDLAYRLRLEDFIVYPTHTEKAPVTIVWGKRAHDGPTTLDDLPTPGLHDDHFYGPVMIDPHWEPYHQIKMFIDPAGLGPDETAWVVIGRLHGNLFVLKTGAYTGGHSHDNLSLIIHDAQRFKVQDLYIESNYGGDMLAQLIQPHLTLAFLKPGHPECPQGWACAVHTVPHQQKWKEARILDTLHPLLKQHRLILDPQVAKDTLLTSQITRISRVRNCLNQDDRVDALAGAVSQFFDYLNINNELVQSTQSTLALENAIRQYLKEINFPQIHTSIHSF